MYRIYCDVSRAGMFIYLMIFMWWSISDSLTIFLEGGTSQYHFDRALLRQFFSLKMGVARGSFWLSMGPIRITSSWSIILFFFVDDLLSKGLLWKRVFWFLHTLEKLPPSLCCSSIWIFYSGKVFRALISHQIHNTLEISLLALPCLSRQYFENKIIFS